MTNQGLYFKEEHTLTPWYKQLFAGLDRETIRMRAEMPAMPIAAIGQLGMGRLLQEVSNRLKQIYLPTNQELDLLEHLIAIAEAHYSRNYTSERVYQTRVTAPKIGLDDQNYSDNQAILLTGLGGIGKSAMLAALNRVLPSIDQLQLSEQNLSVPCTPVLGFKLAANSAEKHLVADALSRLGEQRFSSRKTISEFQDRLRSLMYTHGTALMLLDELQFLSKSEGSIQKAVSFLIDSLKLGVPVLYCANYSLVHKLMNRPSEEKQRLVSSVIELYPEAPESLDWRRLLCEVRLVAPEIFDFDPESDAEQIFRWTAGLKRMLRLLLVAGLEQVSGDKNPRVTRNTLAKAYQSASYTANRNDVEAIIRLGIKPSVRAEDAPIRSPFPRESKAIQFHESLKTARLKQTTEAAAHACMSNAAQRAHIQALNSPPASVPKQVSATKIAQTSEERLKMTQAFINQQRSGKRL